MKPSLKISTAEAKKTVLDSLKFYQREKRRAEFKLLGIRQVKRMVLTDEAETLKSIHALRWKIRHDFEKNFPILKQKN